MNKKGKQTKQEITKTNKEKKKTKKQRNVNFFQKKKLQTTIV